MTASVTTADFLEQYPGFAEFPSAVIRDALELGESYCPARAWSGRQRKGILLYAAHTLECDRLQQSLAAAAGAEIAAGRANVDSAAAPEDLGSTRYGRQFQQLRRTLPSRIGRPIL